MELNSSFVFQLHLSHEKGDPREYIRRETEWLPASALVRVYTRNVSPIQYGIPFVTRLDIDWARRDLTWQFVSEDQKIWLEWLHAISDLKGGAK